MSETAAKKVLLGVSGGIAAYKACEVLRGLQKAGCDVRVMMTEDATRFVGEVTFEALSGHAVATSLYGFKESSIPHIMLSEWADLIAVVPATGNVMAKMVAGLAAQRFKTVNLPLLIGVILVSKAIGCLGEFILTGGIAATIADFTIGWPGLLLQVFGAWLILKYVK